MGHWAKLNRHAGNESNREAGTRGAGRQARDGTIFGVLDEGGFGMPPRWQSRLVPGDDVGSPSPAGSLDPSVDSSQLGWAAGDPRAAGGTYLPKHQGFLATVRSPKDRPGGLGTRAYRAEVRPLSVQAGGPKGGGEGGFWRAASSGGVPELTAGAACLSPPPANPIPTGPSPATGPRALTLPAC